MVAIRGEGVVVIRREVCDPLHSTVVHGARLAHVLVAPPKKRQARTQARTQATTKTDLQKRPSVRSRGALVGRDLREMLLILIPHVTHRVRVKDVFTLFLSFHGPAFSKSFLLFQGRKCPECASGCLRAGGMMRAQGDV
jgi:hypothetical protein